jgi:hypothetical protein
MTKNEIEIFYKNYYNLYKQLGEIELIAQLERDEEIHKFYHYTSIKVFHSIIDNYEFWAHNVRFSNDYKEEKILTEKYLKENNYTGDNYFISLCAEGDILSQWRGYCHDGGVSIELTFPENKLNFKILGKNKYSDVPNFYSSPLPISYIQKHNNALLESKLKDNLDFLPLYKNGKFKEEKEYRILFNNKKNILDRCILEKILENSTRVPYLRVNFNKINDLQIEKYSYIKDQEYEQLIRKTKNVSGKEFLIIPEYKQQESIYNGISARLDEYYKKNNSKTKVRKISILCEGKPPITKITIAPMHDQERVREQIEHFCKTKYWLRDVPVVCSEIPYTYSLGKK